MLKEINNKYKVHIYTLLGKYPSEYNEVNWFVKDINYTFKSNLGIFSILKYLEAKNFQNIEITLLFPHSIFLNEKNKTKVEIPENKLNDISYLENIVKELFLKEAKKYLSPNFTPEVQVKVIPSISSFKYKNKIYTYDYDFFDRVLFTYLIFLNNFEKDLNEKEHVINMLDVSVGLNALITETLEAFYSLCVYKSIYESYFNFQKKEKLIKENRKFDFYLVSMDPVIGADEAKKEKNIQFYNISKKLFFDAPLRLRDIEEKNKKIFSSLGFDKNHIRDLEKYLRFSLFIFNIIKYNIPPGITILEPKQIEVFKNSFKNKNNSSNFFTELIEKLGKTILNFDLVKESEDSFIIRKNYDYPNSQELFNYIRSLTYLLAFGKVLSDIIFVEKIESGLEKEDNSLKIKISRSYVLNNSLNNNLKNHPYFKHILNIYDHFHLVLNKVFLERDLEGRSQDDIYRRLKDCLEKNISSSDQSHYIKKISERNLLAHSGFEKNSTCIEKKGNYCLVYYHPESKERIKKHILNLE